MPDSKMTDGGDLFIVDNSDKEWKVRNYLSEWADIAKSFDIATGYFEIGALPALDGQWQKLEKLRILMGDEVTRRTKKDRTPHLNSEDSVAILIQALKLYHDERKTMPARVVLHKSSYYTTEEIEGFKMAIEQERLAMTDMISIRPSNIRLFRNAEYPVLRGTHMPLGPSKHLLYTRGSIPFFETYPVLYVPRAIEIELDFVEQSTDMLCQEILSLTKMNWNNTQFDMRDPITLHAARRVGHILKYIPFDVPDSQIARRYSFYM
jgi:hypothetical protein